MINNYLRALELQPDYFGTYYALGYSYFQDGQWEKAIANYLKATELKPDLIDCYQNLGYAYIKLGQGYQALEYYNQLLTFEGAILYPPHNYLREMLIQWQSINFSEISHNSDRKIIKIFQADQVI